MSGACAWCGEASDNLKVWGTVYLRGRQIGTDEPLCPDCLESLIETEETFEKERHETQ